ncbi:MAG: argininosuccinate lyase [Bdellovibrionaceae bacterium]|nr:argininosuccinate lyase [Pseudobdellovibrionaceae bacterium]
MNSKLWGGRFSKETDRRVEAFTSSLDCDARLWEVDIRASLAHARMLGATGIVTTAEAERMVEGLEQVAADLREGRTQFAPRAEDVHSEIERLLTVKIGPVAGKLHTARSRNDQVATDTRLFLREQIDFMQEDLHRIQAWLIEKSELNQRTVLPGLTHMQHAQPVSLAHHLMAYFWMFQRDRERLTDIRGRTNRLPLGSAALAGTGFPIDRRMVARELGFEGLCENSLDAVSDRDFIVEFLSASSLVMMHLSRLCEELILWSMPEFGFVILDDGVTTGSSIMPQKKNPDVAELIRGRVGRVYGQLMASLTMLKALPLAYNRDLQEDKVHLFDALDTVTASLKMMHIMLATAEFRVARMSEALEGDFSNATDLADYLVQKGVAFRQAHEVVGKVVVHCLRTGQALEGLTGEALREFHPDFGDDVVDRLAHDAVMAARTSEGGTAPDAVDRQIDAARGLHESQRPPDYIASRASSLPN